METESPEPDASGKSPGAAAPGPVSSHGLGPARSPPREGELVLSRGKEAAAKVLGPVATGELCT